MIEETTRRLAWLQGRWKGRGSGRYPTIESFEYEESLRFDLDRSYPMIHYEQRTWLIPDRQPSHWESGFIRWFEDGNIEMSNSQDSGRVEVLRGRLFDLDEENGGLRLVLASVVLNHDPRLEQTRRIYTLQGDRLDFRMEMATHTTPQPQIQQHLLATLSRG